MLNDCKIALWIVAVSLSACTASPTKPRTATHSNPRSVDASRGTQWTSDRPRLLIVEHVPAAISVVGFAAFSDMPPIANQALALIVRRRTARFEVPVDVSANASGLTSVVSVKGGDQAVNAIALIRSALQARIGPDQVDTSTLNQLRSQLAGYEVPSPDEVAYFQCTGDIYGDARQSRALDDAATLLSWVETARIQMYSTSHAAFSLVGSRSVANQVRQSIDKQLPWPMSRANADGNQILIASQSSVTSSRDRGWGISLAWSLDSIETATRAWYRMRSPDSPLQAQLSALDSDWHIESLSAVAHPVGACLRIDLTPLNAQATPSPKDLERVSRLATHEATIAFNGQDRHLSSPSPLTDDDPKLQARRIAWQALSNRANGIQPTLHAHVRIAQSAASGTRLVNAIKASLAPTRAAPIETRWRHEAGGLEQWVLLATLCGASSETTLNSGSTVAWLRAITKRYSGQRGVMLEPWVHPDGIGIMAHAGTQSLSETPEGLSRRIGDALGGALVAGAVTSADLASVREDILIQLGTGTRHAYDQLLDMIAPNHPSTFEPFGNLESTKRWSLLDMRLRRRQWLSEPMRLSTLVNHSANQATQLGHALSRWLEPYRTDATQCDDQLTRPLVNSELQTTVHGGDSRDAAVYIAVQLTQNAAPIGDSYTWLEWLLNHPEGPLQVPPLDSDNARAAWAHVAGTNQRRVLFIEIDSADESVTNNFLARVRSVLARWTQSGLSPTEFKLVNTWLQENSSRASLNPRKRLGELWTGNSQPIRHGNFGVHQLLGSLPTLAPVTVLKVRKLP